MMVKFNKLHKNNCSQLINRDGYRMIGDFLFGMNKNGTPKRGKEHIVIWRKTNGGISIPKCYDIHHTDFNKTNNNINNLKLLSKIEHRKLH